MRKLSMLRQVGLLTSLQTCNLFGFNELRHSHSGKKVAKYVAMTVLWLLLGALLIGYICLLTYGLCAGGMGRLVPSYLFTITSLITFFFGIFKAAGMLFGRSSFEAFSALPLKKSAIVASRFITMYIYDMLMAAVFLMPGLIFYATLQPVDAMFWVVMVLGVILLPLLPLAAASLVGALVTAITSRMKYKSIFSTVLTIGFVMLILWGEMSLTSVAENEADFAGMMIDMATTAGNVINRMYPPAAWFGSAILDGDLLSLALLAAVSVALPVLLVVLVTPKFGTLCSALNAVSTKGNYKMGELRTGSQTSALYRSEFKRYLSHSLWMSNTLVGYVLLIGIGVALQFLDLSAASAMFGSMDIIAILAPFVVGLIAFMSTCTSSAISMEGKNWWLVKSLPVSARALVNSKLLVNLTIALPVWAACVVMFNIAVDASLWARIWMAAVSLLYILLAALMGLRLNAAMPIFDWENEARVVKQSGALSVTMFGGWALALLPAIALFLIPSSMTMILLAAVAAALIISCLLLYRSLTKLRLEKLG